MLDTFCMRNLINKIKHSFSGCEPFWVVQLNKNKKPFKRLCAHCGKQSIRRNGEWISIGFKNNPTSNRF